MTARRRPPHVQGGQTQDGSGPEDQRAGSPVGMAVVRLPHRPRRQTHPGQVAGPLSATIGKGMRDMGVVEGKHTPQ